MGRRTLGTALGVTLAAVTVVVAVNAGGPPPPAPEPAIPGPAPTAQASPGHPSGRLIPTWLPADLRVQVEEETTASEGTSPGWSRVYVRRGPFAGDQDILVISLEDGTPALDVDTEVSRYAGARRMVVQGRPAVLLGLVAARREAVLVWNPAPGRTAQVRGTGVSEEELAGVAEGLLPPPLLDATPLPEGFSELQRSDEHPFPAAVPRQYALDTRGLRGGAAREGSPSVQIISAWGATVPAGRATVTVRDRTGVVTGDGPETVLTWSERPDLVVRVTGRNLGLDVVRRIATELRELSVDEVLARPTGAPVVLARGELGGTPYELRTSRGASGACLELVHDWMATRCSAGPTEDVVDFGGSVSQGVAYGSVLLDATAVRLELDGGQAVETVPVGKEAALGTAFYVAAVPPGARLLAVVALDAGGQVLRRTPAG